ncbi:MAG: hypothetical protein HY763_09325 [Planctomycetes bacterium]|nr:hypothetical protein [Planctomycetota bacterium]
MKKVHLVSALGVLFGLCGAVRPAFAGVRLELRPGSQTKFAGQTVEVGLYAVADPPATPQNVGIINAVLAWDEAGLTLTGYNLNGAYPWQGSSFPSVALNTSFTDGDAYFACNVGSCTSAVADSAGLLVANLVFTTGPATGASTVSVISSLSGSTTRVWDKLTLFGCGGVQIPVTLGPAVSVSVNPCVSALQCSDGNACTADACASGTCTHTPNYVDFTHCCNPADGALTVISDANDCTTDFCNTLTGAVTHTNRPFGSTCGNQDQNACTNPDTCDVGAVCLSNNVTNGAPCDDQDPCSQASSCQSGVCTGSNPVANGTLCTDALDCTVDRRCSGNQLPCTGTGQGSCPVGQTCNIVGTCNNGKCQGTGSPCQSTEFCIEDASCSSSGDCVAPATCVSNQCTNGYKCWECLADPKACQTAADCPSAKPCEGGFCRNCTAPVGCRSSYCGLTHLCTSFFDDEQCLDDIFCNGDEYCDNFGLCQPANPAAADCPSGTVCDEFNDNCVECIMDANCPSGMFCNTSTYTCVECLINGHCNDGNACNGIETCNLTTGDCIPGTPVVCDQPYVCSINVCNPTSAACEPRPAEQVACTSNPDTCPVGFLCGPTNFCFPTNPCSDQDGCTPNDSCANGTCSGQTLPSPGPINMELVAPSAPYAFLANVSVDLNLISTSGSQGIIVAEGSVSWDPVKLGMSFTPPGHSGAFTDPCTTHAGDPLNCDPGLDPARFEYDWFASGMLQSFDPDGLNDAFSDGTAHYVAQVGPGLPDAPITTTNKLWVTTLKFTAIGATTSAGTQVKLLRCVSPGGTFSRVTRGTGQDVTGQIINAVVKVRCGNASHCNDQNPCTIDSCNGATQFCEYTNVANGTACGNATPQSECDLPDSCQAGVCNTNPKPNTTPCTDDGIFCTNDLCNGAGACGHPNKPTGTACDDGLYCTVGEACTLGVCGGGSPRSCGDTFSCTFDSCNETTNVCDHTPQNNLCDDGQYCNGTETCSVSQGCLAGTPPNCSTDGIACTENDFCDESLNACNGIPNNNLCPPGEFCVQRIGCLSGACQPPLVDVPGSRYIKVVPLPANGTDPISLFVDSLDYPCFGKYVGVPQYDVDIDRDGDIDGKVAKLVDDPNQRGNLTPAQWGGTVFVTGEDIVPTDKVIGNNPPIIDSTYRVAQDCGGGALSPPIEVVMTLWGDADENGLVNITDVQLSVYGFQGRYLLPPGWPNGGTTRLSLDHVGLRACDPDFPPGPGGTTTLAVNFTDIQQVVNIFLGTSYRQKIYVQSPQDNCHIPCD